MYTKGDLVKIDQAITKLQMSERVVSVAYGDHIVKYAEVNLKDFLNLRSRIKSNLKSSTSIHKRWLVYFRWVSFTLVLTNEYIFRTQF